MDSSSPALNPSGSEPNDVPHDETREALRKAEEQLHLILENIKDYAVFTVDLENRITSWNIGAERVFGYTEQEALGLDGAVIFTEEDRARGVPEQERRQALERNYAEDERVHLRKDHSRFFASGVMRPLVDEAGRLRGFLKVLRDITARKQAEINEHEQRVLAEALEECALVLSQTLKLGEVLDSILNIVGRVTQHDAAYILIIETATINNLRTYGFSADDTISFENQLRETDLRLEAFPPLHELVTTRRPILVDLTQSAANMPAVTGAQSLLAVPVLIDDQVIGLLAVMSRTVGFYSQRDSQPLQAFAYHAASAIRNAQLFQQAQELAAFKERQQVARELHDAVTQTLFTASLLVDSLPTLWPQQPEEVREGMAHLNRLIKGALAELRSLLLELRPRNLETTSFTKLLHQLVASTEGRRQSTIFLDLEGEPVLMPEVHLAIYRIAQEAFNNIAKHSKAVNVWVEMRGAQGKVELRIRDDGIGFAADAEPSGLGLQIMRERAAAVEARISITSRQGRGTEVYVLWPALADPALPKSPLAD